MLAELRQWYDDWSESARTVITRRDYAIRIGIAHRKASRSASTPPPAPAPAPVVTRAEEAPPESRAA